MLVLFLCKIEEYILSERILSYEKIMVVTLTNKKIHLLMFGKQASVSYNLISDYAQGTNAHVFTKGFSDSPKDGQILGPQITKSIPCSESSRCCHCLSFEHQGQP